MEVNKILQGIGALTLMIVIFSVAWVPVSAVITMNSTGGVDTLKVLKILPSSGETVNVSSTFVINATSGDITKMGKFTQNLEIEKASAAINLDATSGNPFLDFDQDGTNKIRIYFDTGGAQDLAIRNSTSGYIFNLGADGNVIDKLGTLLPRSNNTFNLGSATYSWKDGWIENAWTVGHLVFGYNNWSLYEAEKFYPDNPNARGMLWVNGNNETVAWLDESGGFHFKGPIEEFWDGGFE